MVVGDRTADISTVSQGDEVRAFLAQLAFAGDRTTTFGQQNTDVSETTLRERLGRLSGTPSAQEQRDIFDAVSAFVRTQPHANRQALAQRLTNAIPENVRTASRLYFTYNERTGDFELRRGTFGNVFSEGVHSVRLPTSSLERLPLPAGVDRAAVQNIHTALSTVTDAQGLRRQFPQILALLAGRSDTDQIAILNNINEAIPAALRGQGFRFHAYPFEGARQLFLRQNDVPNGTPEAIPTAADLLRDRIHRLVSEFPTTPNLERMQAVLPQIAALLRGRTEAQQIELLTAINQQFPAEIRNRFQFNVYPRDGVRLVFLRENGEERGPGHEAPASDSTNAIPSEAVITNAIGRLTAANQAELLPQILRAIGSRWQATVDAQRGALLTRLQNALNGRTFLGEGLQIQVTDTHVILTKNGAAGANERPEVARVERQATPPPEGGDLQARIRAARTTLNETQQREFDRLTPLLMTQSEQFHVGSREGTWHFLNRLNSQLRLSPQQLQHLAVLARNRAFEFYGRQYLTTRDNIVIDPRDLAAVLRGDPMPGRRQADRSGPINEADLTSGANVQNGDIITVNTDQGAQRFLAVRPNGADALHLHALVGNSNTQTTGNPETVAAILTRLRSQGRTIRSLHRRAMGAVVPPRDGQPDPAPDAPPVNGFRDAPPNSAVHRELTIATLESSTAATNWQNGDHLYFTFGGNPVRLRVSVNNGNVTFTAIGPNGELVPGATPRTLAQVMTALNSARSASPPLQIKHYRRQG